MIQLQAPNVCRTNHIFFPADTIMQVHVGTYCIRVNIGKGRQTNTFFFLFSCWVLRCTPEIETNLHGTPAKYEPVVMQTNLVSYKKLSTPEETERTNNMG